MTKVITYGTYDLLHHGHIRLLERAKALGDYLIVGVTSDDYDRSRGKINARQSLIERIDAVRKLGIADEILVEEYEGQKIDDIRRLGVDIFTVGSDWVGKFDYLKEYCKVIYLDRTQGVSSSMLRGEQHPIRIGIYGESQVVTKYRKECAYVNGLFVSAVCSEDKNVIQSAKEDGTDVAADFDLLLKGSDAVYITTHPTLHEDHIQRALEAGKDVLCESPIALSGEKCKSLFALAESKGLILMDSIKTAYATAYNRMLLLAKTGKIGRIVSIDATCTSLAMMRKNQGRESWQWNSRCAWGPVGVLPALQLLGTHYKNKHIVSFYEDTEKKFDFFTKIDLEYPDAVASIKVGKGVKSEGSLVVSGTKGYIYVPAPWWKTDYFEIRYENSSNNRRYFYQLDGEGIRNELRSFLNLLENRSRKSYISENVSCAISDFML